MTSHSKLIVPRQYQPMPPPEIVKVKNLESLYNMALEKCARLQCELDAQNAIIGELVHRAGGTADIPNIVFQNGNGRGMKAIQMPGALLITLTEMPKDGTTPDSERTENHASE